MRYELVKLKDVATYVNGKAFKSTDWEAKGKPIIRIQNLNNKTKPYNYTSQEFEQKYAVKKGDILISWSASLGIFEWEDEDAWLNQHIFKVVFDGLEVDKNYFKLALSNVLEHMKSLVHGATMKHITKGKFDNIKIPLPPKPIQIKIANALDKAQELVDSRKAQIEKYDELLQSVFLDMFGDPVTNPKGWEVKILEELCEFITKGTTPKSNLIFEEYKKELIPFIKVYQITDDGKLDLTDRPNYISNETHQSYKRSKVVKGDILMNIVGPPLGKIGMVDGIFNEYNINQAIAFFRTKNQLNNRYLLHLLKNKSMLQFIVNIAVGVRQQNISLKQCRELKIIIPPLELQNKFAEIVEKTESEKKKLEKSLVELENNFNSIMQKAFKGELF